jgi:hypothetical protein
MPTTVVNQTNIALQNLPQSKRISPIDKSFMYLWDAFMKVISYGATWVYDLFYRYERGTGYQFYDSLTVYDLGERVKDITGVYESKVASNLGNALGNVDYWTKLLPTPISTLERALYNGKRINLEYQLNKEYAKQLIDNGFIGFKQPMSYSGTGQLPLSDIYVETVVPEFTSFVSADSSSYSSASFDNHSSGYSFDTEIYVVPSTFKFSINIPTAVYNDLGADNDIRTATITSFVNKYRPAGTQFEIITY